MDSGSINEERAKDALKRSVSLIDKSAKRHFLVYLDRNAFTKSRLFLTDAGVAKELDKPEELKKFQDAGLFVLEVIDQQRFYQMKGTKKEEWVEFSKSPYASDDTKKERARIEIVTIKLAAIDGTLGFGYAFDNIMDRDDGVLEAVAGHLKVIDDLARALGKDPREVRF